MYGPGNAAGKRARTIYLKRVKKSQKKNLLTRAKKLASVKLIKRVINKGLEKKATFFYNQFNDGSGTGRATGAFGDRGWASQNPIIGTNNTDIHQLIPYVRPGTDDWERIGKRINVTSLTVNGAVRIWLPILNNITPEKYPNFAPTNIRVVIYVLQHVSLKDYPNLYAKNDFTQMLSNGVGATTNFVGEYVNSNMPVASQYYRLLKKKIIKLKYAGVVPRPNSISTTTPVSISNGHQWFSTFGFSLGKLIPKQLKFPEESAPSGIIDQPTNSSVFMAMGCYNEYEPPNSSPFQDLIFEQTYLSKLTFTDA
jgi:hypothetical protein